MPRKMEHLHSKVPDLKSCLQEPLVLLSDSMREEADPVSYTGLFWVGGTFVRALLDTLPAVRTFVLLYLLFQKPL